MILTITPIMVIAPIAIVVLWVGVCWIRGINRRLSTLEKCVEKQPRAFEPRRPEPKEQPVCKTDSYGTKRWLLNGELHRTDGPAVERASGDKHWYQNGELHRVDGPAVEWANGDKRWFVNGVEQPE